MPQSSAESLRTHVASGVFVPVEASSTGAAWTLLGLSGNARVRHQGGQPILELLSPNRSATPASRSRRPLGAQATFLPPSTFWIA